MFLVNAGLLLAFLTLVIVAVDFSLNFDEYVKIAKAALALRGGVEDVGVVQTGLLSIWLVLDLWWPRFFLLVGFLLGPVLVGALGFTCAQLVKGREVVAMVAAGLPLWRIARPMLLATIGVLCLQIVNRELILPKLAPLLTRDKQEAGKNTMGVMSDFSVDAQGRLIYARQANLDTNTIDGLWVWERDDAGLMRRRITASKAVWRDGAWQLTDGVAVGRSFGEETRDAGPGARLPQEPVAVLRTENDPTSLRLRRFEGMASNLSTGQLTQLVTRYRSQPPSPMLTRRVEGLERLRWGRYAGLFCTFLTVVMCVPFFLMKEPANILHQSLRAAPVGMVAFALTLLGVTVAIPGLPAQVSVLVPAMLLVPGAILAYGAVRS
jgi:lipopolysaccharide export system permease protein